MFRIRHIRKHFKSPLAGLFELLPPLFPSLINEELRYENHQTLQPLYAKALAPCPARASQTAYCRKRGDI